MVIPSKLNGKKGNCSMPSLLTAEDFVSEEYVPGSLVWAKHASFPWWPAMVEDDPDEEEYYRKDLEDDEEYHVVFITDKPQKVRRAWIAAKNLAAYVNQPASVASLKMKKNYIPAFKVSKQIADSAVCMTLPRRLKKFSFARLSSLKFPVAKKETKVPKVLVKKNGRGGVVSAVPNKKRRLTNTAIDTTNDVAITVPKVVHTAEVADGASDKTVSETGCDIDASVPEVSHTIEVASSDPPSPPTAAVNVVSSKTDVVQTYLPSTADATQQLNSLNSVSEMMNSEDEDLAAFDKELELYSSEDELPPSPEDTDSLPESLRNKGLDELFSDVMSDSLGSDDDMAPYEMEFDSNNETSPLRTSTEVPIKGKYVLSEEDIWDINNPNLKSTAYFMRLNN